MLVLALSLGLTLSVSAQTYVGTVGQAVYPTVSLRLYGLPMLISTGDEIVNETAWVSYSTASNYLEFPTDPLHLFNATKPAHFTTPIPTLSLHGGEVTLGFAGSDQDNRPYTGTLVLTYTTYYSRGGGGKGGGGAGYRMVVTGGSITITYE